MLYCGTIASRLQENINYFAVLIHSPPEVVLLTVDLMARHTGEDFIYEECVTVTTVLSLKSSSVYSAKFDAPEPDALVADHDTSFS